MNKKGKAKSASERRRVADRRTMKELMYLVLSNKRLSSRIVKAYAQLYGLKLVREMPR